MALLSRDSVWLLVPPVLRSEQSLRVLSHQTEIKMLLLIQTLIMTVAANSSRALFLSQTLFGDFIFAYVLYQQGHYAGRNSFPHFMRKLRFREIRCFIQGLTAVKS